MKTKRRWMKSVIEESRKDVRLPWQNKRAKARPAKRRAA